MSDEHKESGRHFGKTFEMALEDAAMTLRLPEPPSYTVRMATALLDLHKIFQPLLEENSAYEREVRRLHWLNHGHPYPALYGDDGEMQCSSCPLDYKRAPIGVVRETALRARMTAPGV